jgi:hypothetical protein
MNKTYVVGLSFVVASFVVVGCGGSDGESGASSVSTKSITTVEDAKQASAAVAQMNSMSSFGSDLASSSYAPSRAPSLAPINNQQDCLNGGTMSTSGDIDDSTIDITQSYNNCNSGGTVADGSMRIKQNKSGSNISMGITANKLQMSLNNMSYYMDFDMSIDTNQNFNPMDMKLDGEISLSATANNNNYDYNVEYNNFLVHTSGQYMNISGKVSMDSNTFSCYNGSYEIKTLEDLSIDGYNGYSSGILEVNGVTYSYHGDSVDITLADGTTQTLSQSELAVGTCD